MSTFIGKILVIVITCCLVVVSRDFDGGLLDGERLAQGIPVESEEGQGTQGQAPGAPARPDVAKKVLDDANAALASETKQLNARLSAIEEENKRDIDQDSRRERTTRHRRGGRTEDCWKRFRPSASRSTSCTSSRRPSTNRPRSSGSTRFSSGDLFVSSNESSKPPPRTSQTCNERPSRQVFRHAARRSLTALLLTESMDATIPAFERTWQHSTFDRTVALF